MSGVSRHRCKSCNSNFSDKELLKAHDCGTYQLCPVAHSFGGAEIPPIAYYQPVKESASPTRTFTLPVDSLERKEYPIVRGCIKYFPAALSGVARISKIGNDKHNPNQDLQHARGKSTDHSDCVVRHLIDLEDLLAAAVRNGSPLTPFGQQQILDEASSLAWRALALSQELHERFGAPLAPGAKLDKPE